MLRVLATPRWVGWTLLMLAIVVTCGGMAYWQLGRAESPTGSLLNAGYAFQWPLFGVFFAALWWRMLRQEAQILAEMTRADSLHADSLHADSLHADSLHADSGVAVDGVAGGRSASPFTPRPVGVRAGDADDPPTPGSARAEYNAMLAELAARDDAESVAGTGKAADGDAGAGDARAGERTGG